MRTTYICMHKQSYSRMNTCGVQGLASLRPRASQDTKPSGPTDTSKASTPVQTEREITISSNSTIRLVPTQEEGNTAASLQINRAKPSPVQVNSSPMLDAHGNMLSSSADVHSPTAEAVMQQLNKVFGSSPVGERPSSRLYDPKRPRMPSRARLPSDIA
jgi:hypothetical protein